MELKKEWKVLLALVAVFLGFYYLPLGNSRFDGAVMEALSLAKWYAREHVLLCLVPAFFIAGAIGVFVSQASVMRYLGANAPKPLAYGVASVSGTVLAVCSCTVLPLFAGIYRMGAGLGPACAFLYSGPAINILAIVLTARILGLEMGIARAVGAVGFGVIIGLLMHVIFRKEEKAKQIAQADMPAVEASRPLWQTVVYFAAMVGVLVFANWGKPLEAGGVWAVLFASKWVITGFCAALLGLALAAWFRVGWWRVLLAMLPPVALGILFPGRVTIVFVAGVVSLSVLLHTSHGETEEWLGQTWGFTKQIFPLLFGGVLVAGFLLGTPGREGMIPNRWVEMLVGASPDVFVQAVGLDGSAASDWIRPLWPLWTNFFAALAGAFMYFATLTEVPILQGLMGSGMGKGPALALLLAGPALSLPSMLVLRGVMGTKKTVVYVSLVVVMATITGMIYGAVFE